MALVLDWLSKPNKPSAPGPYATVWSFEASGWPVCQFVYGLSRVKPSGGAVTLS